MLMMRRAPLRRVQARTTIRPAGQKPDRDVAYLAIIEPGILHRQMIALEHLGGIGHVQTPFFQVSCR